MRGRWQEQLTRVRGFFAPERLRLSHYLLLALMAFVFFAPGQRSVPPLDRDESRYAVATTQMLETGNFIDVRYLDQPRYLQPAGIYWLQAASVSLLSSPQARAIWAFRVPSLLSAMLVVLLTAATGQRLFGARAGLMGGALMAMCLLLGFESRLAKIDATLCATALTAQAALLRIYMPRPERRTSRGWAAVFWLALGWGLLLKGPLILLVSGGTVAVLALVDRQRGWLRRLHAGWGAPLMLLVAAPWFVAIGLVSHGAFFQHAVERNFIGKVAKAQQSHGAPPGYYLALANLTFWPASLLVVLSAPFAWMRRRSPEVRFLLAWIVPTWVVFELIATKLPHYLLPLYPALACLAAGAACTAPTWRPRRLLRGLVGGYAAVWLAIGAALAAAGPLLIWRLEGRVDPTAVGAGGAAVLLLAAALWRLRRRGAAAALVPVALASWLINANTYHHVLPSLDQLWISPRIAAAVARVKPCPGSALATSLYREPSLVFLLGTRTRLVDPAGAADRLAADPRCGLVLIGAPEQGAFFARMQADGVAARPLAQIDGRNYSYGKPQTLTLFGAGPRIAR